MDARTLVIGVGNPDRGDDGVGALVVRLLGGRVPAVAHRRDAAALLDALDHTDHAILVDACRSGATPGEVMRFDVAATPLPALAAPLAAHGTDLGQALELARALGRLPARCTVYAIEGCCFAVGSAPCEAVSSAASAVAERIVRECSAGGRRRA